LDGGFLEDCERGGTATYIFPSQAKTPFITHVKDLPPSRFKGKRRMEEVASLVEVRSLSFVKKGQFRLGPRRGKTKAVISSRHVLQKGRRKNRVGG